MTCTVTLILSLLAQTPGGTTLRIDANQITNRITPHMTGSCIEDVNHEIYGGIYSQMIFGESFEEPGHDEALQDAGFSIYGGSWTLTGEYLEAAPGPGFKIVAKDWAASGDTLEAEVDIFFPPKSGNSAGLIVNVGQAGVGADAFNGYEVSLSQTYGYARLGRHHQNWELLKDVPWAVPAEKWIRLKAKVESKKISVSVDGKEAIVFEDLKDPLPPGSVGLRTWESAVRFRDLRAKSGEKAWKASLVREPSSGPRQAVSGQWRLVREGKPSGELDVEEAGAFNGKRCQKIRFLSGDGALGVENRGLNRWGLSFVQGKPYEGYLFARGEAEAMLSLEDAGGRSLAEQRLTVKSAGWTRFAISLTPAATVPDGRFALKLGKPGTIWLDQVFLSPSSWGTFRNLPVRRDIAEALLGQGLTALRLGGWMINAEEYRWKKMVGPRELRPPYKGNWYPFSSNGWGIADFMNFCEKAGFLSVVAVNIEETPEDMADFVEYLRGSRETKWGALRIADGHPEPYGLRLIQIGNEETLNEHYVERFSILVESLHRKDPEITFVIAAWFDEKNPQARRLIELSRKKKVLWDVHVGGDNLRAGDTDGAMVQRIGELFRSWCPEANVKICILEENGGLHNLQRALGHAHMVNTMERMGDLVLIDCPANCLQPLGQNDNGWDQGQLFFTSSQVWGMPPYYAQQMIAASYQPNCLAVAVDGAKDALDVTATKSDDGRRIVLKIVNLEGRPIAVNPLFAGFEPKSPTAHVTELHGELGEINTPREPEKIVPRQSVLPKGEGGFRLNLRPHSFTVVRFE